MTPSTEEQRLTLPEHPGDERPKILVVDDDPTNLNVLLNYLHHQGYKVLIATSGEQALQQSEYTHPDLILLDVMMPGINGFETCRRLKTNPLTHDIPVIFMTALSETMDKLRGFEVGGGDYIIKPFQPEEVVARVKAHLLVQQLQRQLQRQNEQLHEANASKDKFFSIVAHDLRGPLGSLQGMFDVLLDNLESAPKEELVKVILMQRGAVKNLFTLLENLLTWSRMQRGLLEYIPQTHDLYQIAAQDIALLQPTAHPKQIALCNTIPPNMLVLADYYMLDTILRNLLSNAIKFTRPGGTVTIAALRRDDRVEVSVSDTGIGIAAEHLPKLFRIDTKYKRLGTAQERGTGLGLILCKEFVEKNGGSIWIESVVEHGATIRFTLPVSPAQSGSV